VVVFYAGVLTTAENLHVGIGMMIVGGVLVAIPTRQAFRRYWSPAKPWNGSAGKSNTKKRKSHLKVVKGNKEEEPPTYH